MDDKRQDSVREVSKDEAFSQLESLYRDPKGVAKALEEGVQRRQKEVASLQDQLQEDSRLEAEMARDPVGTLRDRGLLQPFDRLHLDLDHAGTLGEILWPWPCIIRCRWVIETEVRWICYTIGGFVFCRPIIVYRLRRVCSIIC